MLLRLFSEVGKSNGSCFGTGDHETSIKSIKSHHTELEHGCIVGEKLEWHEVTSSLSSALVMKRCFGISIYTIKNTRRQCTSEKWRECHGNYNKRASMLFFSTVIVIFCALQRLRRKQNCFCCHHNAFAFRPTRIIKKEEESASSFHRRTGAEILASCNGNGLITACADGNEAD